MTATYTLSIYEILQPVIKNEQKTKELVQNIESVIDARIEEMKNGLATKEDIRIVEKSITDSFKWLVGIMITLFGLTITIMFFLIKSKV
jgi:hypothetical protein